METQLSRPAARCVLRIWKPQARLPYQPGCACQYSQSMMYASMSFRVSEVSAVMVPEQACRMSTKAKIPSEVPHDYHSQK